jgi:hypothetical protein
MTLEELKKLDRHLQEIPYPFGSDFPLLCKALSETARQLDLPVSEAIKEYISWKYGKR